MSIPSHLSALRLYFQVSHSNSTQTLSLEYIFGVIMVMTYEMIRAFPKNTQEILALAT